MRREEFKHEETQHPAHLGLHQILAAAWGTMTPVLKLSGEWLPRYRRHGNI
jgi:hypothetical protein